MKRNHFTSFVFGIITVVLGSFWVFAVNNAYFKANGSLNFAQLKSTANGNKLTQSMRDSLIEGLSWQNSSNAGIPAGAVMAFNLSTCPAGWTRFSGADGRFIMGSQSEIGSRGGTGSIMMKANQLAPHSHWFVDTIFTENVNPAYNSNNMIGNWNTYKAVVDNVSGRWRFGTSSRTDYDNHLITVARRTGQRIVRGDDYVYWGDAERGTRVVNSGSRAFPWVDPTVDQERVGKQQPLNVLNPYIKLLYCQKN